ncbi:MAG: ABC transporter substrate-binding protein [Gammaproteobacteria bacterium]
MSDERPTPTRIELAIARAMRRRSMSRRTFFVRAGQGGLALGAAMSLPALLAACAPGSQAPTGPLRWLNWPAYIDIDEEIDPDPTQYPSLNAFIASTGIDVEYNEGLLDNADFLATYAPDLRAGNPTAWDVMSPGGWVVERMARNSWLEELDHSKLPNWTANCADYAKGLWFDADNQYSVWWQGGITGIGYDPNLTEREITSFDDLLDPAFSGRVGGFSDMRDMFGLTLLSLGVQPANATVDDVQRAQEKLLDVPEGHFAFYDNSYYDALAAGNLALSVAWSGDISQMQLNDNPEVRFVIPDTGGMRWNDNLVIPKGTSRKDDAHKLIDHYYDVTAAATLSEWIGYFTPVRDLDQRVLEDAAAAETDEDREYLEVLAPTLVPTTDQINNTHLDKQLTEEEEAEWNSLFDVVLGA